MSAAVWDDLVNAGQSAIRTLALTYSGGTSLPDAQVYARKIPTDRQTNLPFALSARGDRIRHEGGSFEEHEDLFPVAMIFAFASNQDYSLNVDLPKWEQQVIDMVEEFQTTIQPLITSGVITEVEISPDLGLDPELWKKNLDVGGITATFRVTRARSR